MIDRRTFLGAAGAVLLWPAARALGAHHEAGEAKSAAPEGLTDAVLEKTGFVYVSPLQKDGSESTCHGEVWYGWLDGAVVIITSADTWKAAHEAADMAGRAARSAPDSNAARGTHVLSKVFKPVAKAAERYNRAQQRALKDAADNPALAHAFETAAPFDAGTMEDAPPPMGVRQGAQRAAAEAAAEGARNMDPETVVRNAPKIVKTVGRAHRAAGFEFPPKEKK